MSALRSQSDTIENRYKNNRNNENLLNLMHSSDSKSLIRKRIMPKQNNLAFQNFWTNVSSLTDNINNLDLNSTSKLIDKSSHDYSVNWETDSMDLTDCCNRSYLMVSNFKEQDNLRNLELENMDLTKCCNSGDISNNANLKETNILKNTKRENMDLTDCYDFNSYDFQRSSTLKKKNNYSRDNTGTIDSTDCYNSAEFPHGVQSQRKNIFKNMKLENKNLTKSHRNDNYKLKHYDDDSFLFNSVEFENITEFEIESRRKSHALQKMYLNRDFEEPRRQNSYQNHSEINDFINGLTESLHLSDDSVFERFNETKYINNRFTNVKSESDSFYSKLENTYFYQILKNVMRKILFNLKMFLWRHW